MYFLIFFLKKIDILLTNYKNKRGTYLYNLVFFFYLTRTKKKFIYLSFF